MVDSVRVLHVDDDPAVADLAATILDREEDMFDVVSTTNPTEAIELLERRFDCIVSDYRMPEIDGLELLEVVREIHPDLPFIIFTGCGSEEVASEAISAGVTGYVPKGSGTTPYESLANQIRNAVEGYRTGRGDDECDGIDESDLDRVLGAYVTTRTDDGAVTVDECSDRFADQLGYSPSDILGKPLSSLVVDDIETPFDTTEDPAATDDAGTADADETWQTTTFEGADGEPVPMRYRTIPGFETDRTLIAFVDDSERVALAEKVTWY